MACGLVLVACVCLVPYRFLQFTTPAGVLANYLPAVLVSTIVGVLMLWRRGMFLDLLRKDALLGAIAALVAADLLAAIGGVNSTHSLSRVAYYFLTGPLVFWVLSCGFRRDGHSRILLIAVSGCSGLAAVYGISEFVSGSNWLYGSTLSITNPRFAASTGGAEFVDRILGTIGHPVAFGAFLLLSLPASLYLASTSSSARYLGFASAGSAVLAIVLTFSRGAWIGLVIAASVWLAAGLRGETGGGVAWRVLIVGALLIVGGTLVLTTRGTYSEFVERYDSNPRILAYVHAAILLPEHLITGSGTGTFRWLGKPLGSRLDATDSMFLTRLIEGGVFGLATLLYLLQRIYAGFAGSSREKRVLLAVLLGVAADMMIFDMLSWPATRSWFWIQVAVGTGIAREHT